MFKRLAPVVAIAIAAALLSSCSAVAEPAGQDKAIKIAEERKNYEPTHDIEGHNYNARVKLGDNPAALIWCTAFPSNPNSAPITVPVVGKLTSGNKRPYPTQIAKYGDYGTYHPELPGPDSMYGSSGEYRYGFRPDGVYVDFYNLETFCTSAPTVYQKQSTTIDISSSGSDQDVESALKTCRAKNPDPSVPCAAAQALMGEVLK